MRNVSAMPEVGGRLSAMRSIELSIRGMTCAACAARIEKKISMFDQDVGAAVSFATEKATITAAETSWRRWWAGYLRRRLILALVFFVPLSGWSAYAMFHLDRGPGASALQELAHASAGGIYLEVAAAVMTFLLAGRFYEARARGSAAEAAIALARAARKTIRRNLAWAFGYNVAAVPLAALGFLNPLHRRRRMTMSSVLVVANSLRLRRFGRGLDHGQRRAYPC